MSGYEDSHYVCKCGSTHFTHEVTSVYDESFDTSTDEVILENEYSDGETWICVKCRAGILPEAANLFFDQLYNAPIADKR